MCICLLVFYFGVRFKLSIFFNLVLFPLKMHRRRGEKLTGKKLNVDRQFFKDVTCVTLCNSVQPNCNDEEVGGRGSIGSTNSSEKFSSFSPFPFINTSFQLRLLYNPVTLPITIPSQPTHFQ